MDTVKGEGRIFEEKLGGGGGAGGRVNVKKIGRKFCFVYDYKTFVNGSESPI